MAHYPDCGEVESAFYPHCAILCAPPHTDPTSPPSHMYTLKTAELNDVRLVMEGLVGTAETHLQLKFDAPLFNSAVLR